MLKTVYEKWEELKKEDSSIIKQFYLGEKSKAKIYFCISSAQNLGIFIEFEKGILSNLDIPVLSGMKIVVCDANNIDNSKEYIYIENLNQDEEIFEAFSSSLSDELFECRSYIDLYNGLINTIKKYKDYFSNPNKFLSKQEEQGLCAELIELSKLIDIRGEQVVNNWLGPSKNKRDFVFEDASLEIKSTQTQENTSIKISNENQLDSNYPSNLKHLFLKVYVMEDREIGINVVSCIKNVFDKLTNISIQQIFNSNLIKLGINHKAYKPRFNFSIEDVKAFEIIDEFPKIISSNIPKEIYDVSYRLSLSNLDKHIVSEDFIYGQL